MLEESGCVRELMADGIILVATVRQRACGGCQAAASCAVAATQAQPDDMVLARSGRFDLQVGDQVVLGLQESVFWSGLVVLYGLPLAGLVIGGLLGQWRANDRGAIFGALLGLALALLSVRWLSHHLRSDNWLPIVIKKLSK